MARNNESLSGLYLRLGLDFSELDGQFIQASQTLRSNMQTLSRQNTIIRLQAEADLTGVEDADQRLEILTQSLNQQIENQRNRLRLATAAWMDSARATGNQSEATQRARIATERERLALRRLESQLQSLRRTQNNANGGMSNFIESLSSFAGKAAPVVAGIMAVQGAISAVADSTLEFLERYRELQKQSYELNMSIPTTKDFLRTVKLGGGDIGDFEGYIRGITDAYVKGEVDDPEFVALSKYGAKITDVTGRLKNFKEISEEVFKAWEKAAAAGESIEFLQLTGGESGVRDAIQLFERYKEAKEDAAKVANANVDFEQMHQLDRSLNLLSEQFDEFKNAVGSALAPVADTAINGLFNLFHKGTEIISDNTEEVQENKEAWSKLRDEVETPVNVDNNPLSQYAIQRIKQFRDELEDLQAELDNWGEEFDQASAANSLWLRRELTDKLHVSDEERLAIEELYAAKEEKINRQRLDQEMKEREETAERIKTLTQETADIEYEITHTAFENQVHEIRSANERIIESLQEKGAAAEEIAAQVAKAAAEEAKAVEDEINRIKDLNKSLEDKIFEATHSQFENDMRRLNQEAFEALQEGASAALVQQYFGIKSGELMAKAREKGDYTKRPRVEFGNQPMNITEMLNNDNQHRYLASMTVGVDQLRLAEERLNESRLNELSTMQKGIEVIRGVESAYDQATNNIDLFNGTQSTNFAGAGQSSIEIIRGTESNRSEQVQPINILSSAIEGQRQLQEQLQPISDYANSLQQIETVMDTASQSSLQFQTSLSNLSQQLSSMGTMSLELPQNRQQTPPSINVSPNINVDVNLGGAYVFDDAMKQTLTNDIANQVTEEVTKAVETATRSVNLSFAS